MEVGPLVSWHSRICLLLHFGNLNDPVFSWLYLAIKLCPPYHPDNCLRESRHHELDTLWMIFGFHRNSFNCKNHDWLFSVNLRHHVMCALTFYIWPKNTTEIWLPPMVTTTVNLSFLKVIHLWFSIAVFFPISFLSALIMWDWKSPDSAKRKSIVQTDSHLQNSELD